MIWVIIIVIAIMIAGLLGGMGFFGPTDSKHDRRGGGDSFIDWML